MRLLKWLMGSTAGLMLISCVTINIYFPAAAAEKAADRIIEEVWSREGTTPQPAAPDDSSQLKQNLPIAMQVLNWLVSPAQAEANLNINSPAINALQAKMKQRHERLHPYYQTGAVGLTSDGLITLREASAVPLKDRNTVNTLVAEENQDRKALYAEIARANGHPEWESEIQETFARRWISNAAKGWWFQQGGSWQQK